MCKAPPPVWIKSKDYESKVGMNINFNNDKSFTSSRHELNTSVSGNKGLSIWRVQRTCGQFSHKTQNIHQERDVSNVIYVQVYVGNFWFFD